MKTAVLFTTVLALSFSTVGLAEEAKPSEKPKPIQSGLQAGEFIAPFHVIKFAGAEEDGIEAGEETCYVCRNGSRPQVMVFSRSTDKSVKQLVQALDEAVEKNEDLQLRAFVTLLGEDPDELEEAAGKFAKDSKTKHIPFVVPFAFEQGPEDYELHAKAEVTVLLAVDGKVKVNHAYSNAEKLDTKTIIKDVEKLFD